MRQQLDAAGARLRRGGSVRPGPGEPHDREPWNGRWVRAHELLHGGWFGRRPVPRCLASRFRARGPFKYYGVPTAKQVAGDLHVAIAFAFPSLTDHRSGAIRGAVLQGSDGSHGDARCSAHRADGDRPPRRRRTFGSARPARSRPSTTSSSTSASPRRTAARSATITASEGVPRRFGELRLHHSGLHRRGRLGQQLGPEGWARRRTWTATAFGFTGIGFGSADAGGGSDVQGCDSATGTITP